MVTEGVCPLLEYLCCQTNMDNVETEEVNGILMHWSPEEIRNYYELIWQQYTKHGIYECNDKVKQPTYENFEEFESIEEKLRIQVFEEILRTKNISQQPR